MNTMPKRYTTLGFVPVHIFFDATSDRVHDGYVEFAFAARELAAQPYIAYDIHDIVDGKWLKKKSYSATGKEAISLATVFRRHNNGMWPVVGTTFAGCIVTEVSDIE